MLVAAGGGPSRRGRLRLFGQLGTRRKTLEAETLDAGEPLSKGSEGVGGKKSGHDGEPCAVGVDEPAGADCRTRGRPCRRGKMLYNQRARPVPA